MLYSTTRLGSPQDALHLNVLITDNGIWHCLTLATCYQLAQSVLKIGFALAKKGGIGGGGIGGGGQHGVLCTWQLPGCRKPLVGTG